jgi:phosphomannomutase
MKNEIKFGTDGWRGITGFDFIEEKVKVISAGICEYLSEQKNAKPAGGQAAGPKVVIGYDTRFLSGRFAKAAANVIGNNGVTVALSDRFVTTPALSCAVLNNRADLGVMITASHNPYYYNGYKVKGPYGGSATMDIVRSIEEKVNMLNNNKEFKASLNNSKHSVNGDGFESNDFSRGYRDNKGQS